MASSESATPPAGAADRVIDEFRPLSRCLEWRVSGAYWLQMGVLPFAQQEVPFIVNNSGWLSDSAALMLLASCEEAPPAGRFAVLEYGAGTGLFARHFLDAFRAHCRQRKLDLYDRLTFIVTDRSPTAVAQWAAMGLFDDHAGHVRAQVLDAASGPPAGDPLRAVFCNYVLDQLPAAVVRTGPDGRPQQACVRTHLLDDALVLRSYGDPRVEQVRAAAASDDPAALAGLYPLLSLFDQEVAFRPDGAAQVPGVGELLGRQPPGRSILSSFGALACLGETARLLDPDGFVLVRDYGVTAELDERAHSMSQRFGSTTALGLNFPLLEDGLRKRELLVRTPPGDGQQKVHARLISRRPLPRTAAVFDDRFGDQALQDGERALEQVRAHVTGGRLEQALAGYRSLISESPRDWSLIGEFAQVAALVARDLPLALEQSAAALALNPHYTSWLWNIRGDTLSALQRHDEALQAYREGARINPKDPRSQLGLADSFSRSGDHGAALAAVARGLEHDRKGNHRERLLGTQRLVLMAITGKATGEMLRMTRRLEGFSQW